MKMADKLRRQKDLITRTVDRFKETTSVDYARYFEGSPTYVTYYQLDDIATKQDEALENVHSLIGRSSPNKYKKIEDVVIYGIDALSISNEINDRGLESLITGDFVLLPDSIRPDAGDFFVFDEQDLTDHLFRINDVQYDKASPKKFFRCSFSLYPDNSELIFDNVIDDYVLDYQERSGENFAVVKKADSVTAEKIKLLVDSMIDRYKTLFYDEDMDTFVGRVDSFQTKVVINTDSGIIFEGQPVFLVSTSNGYDGVRRVTGSETVLGYAVSNIPANSFGRIRTESKVLANIWSPYLQRFLHENDIMTKFDDKFMEELYISEIREALNPRLFSDEAYHNGIYSRVIRQLPLTFTNSLVEYDYIYDLKSTRNLPFFHGTLQYASLLLYRDASSYFNSFHLLYQTPSDIFGTYPSELKFAEGSSVDISEMAVGTIFYEVSASGAPIDIYRVETVNSVKTPVSVSFESATTLTNELLYNIISRYLITNTADANYLVINEALILQLNNEFMGASIKNYALVPLVIYILKEKIRSYTA
jgi:hypothetical protein